MDIHHHRYTHQVVNRTQNGFTLIELLVTIAIASILTMVSVPLYQNFAIRAKIGGELTLMHPLMLHMNEEYALNSRWPTSNEDAGADEPARYNGAYLKSVEVSENLQPVAMTLTYDAEALPVLRGTDTLVFYPTGGGNSSNWACDKGTIPSKYRPTKCR